MERDFLPSLSHTIRANVIDMAPLLNFNICILVKDIGYFISLRWVANTSNTPLYMVRMLTFKVPSHVIIARLLCRSKDGLSLSMWVHRFMMISTQTRHISMMWLPSGNWFWDFLIVSLCFYVMFRFFKDYFVKFITHSPPFKNSFEIMFFRSCYTYLQASVEWWCNKMAGKFIMLRRGGNNHHDTHN
jgi:hypothetical protein